MAQFCPDCFRLLGESTAVCPSCGTDVSAWDQTRDLDGRLIAALRHPVDDVRARAIYALGRRGVVAASPELAQCAMAWPTDVVQGLQIVEALSLMPEGQERRAALKELALRHPAHAVREAAAATLG